MISHLCFSFFSPVLKERGTYVSVELSIIHVRTYTSQEQIINFEVLLSARSL